MPQTDQQLRAHVPQSPTLGPPFTCKLWKGSWTPDQVRGLPREEVTSGDAVYADARSLAGRDHPLTLPGAGPADPFQLAVQDAAQLS